MIKNWTPSLKSNPLIENELFTELLSFSKTRDNETSEAYKIFSKLLLNRNIHSVTEAIAFNNFKIDQLHDPFLMKSMTQAVSRIKVALDTGQKIMVYGDYDVDGTTSVALMTSFLQELTSRLIYYIPDRYSEGYGISTIGIDYANDQNVDLIIALDCGIKAIDKIDYANSLNIDFIICDHHTPGDKIPDAIAVLDPKRNDCDYPYKELSGCGIGFKLCQALQQTLKTPFDLVSLLDLTAISIACDIVPVTGENRILASLGLHLINSTPRASIQVLLGEKKQNIRISDLVFQIGPKINAAGRISKGKTSVDLLLASEAKEISDFGLLINEFNDQRKDEDKRITGEAIEMIQNNPAFESKNSTVLYHPKWHKGVIGIVASRVIEQYYKPTIILTDSKNDIIGGSVRSVKDFNVYNALEECTDHMIQFGGH
ncbi:MAG: single-stranded-DNA-specific exonuclease, partial [Halieaceae bacterium]